MEVLRCQKFWGTLRNSCSDRPPQLSRRLVFAGVENLISIFLNSPGSELILQLINSTICSCFSQWTQCYRKGNWTFCLPREQWNWPGFDHPIPRASKYGCFLKTPLKFSFVVACWPPPPFFCNKLSLWATTSKSEINKHHCPPG